MREVPRLKIWVARGSGADSAASASAAENNRNHERGERDPFAALTVTKGEWRRRSVAGPDVAAASAIGDSGSAAQARDDVAASAGVNAELVDEGAELAAGVGAE